MINCDPYIRQYQEVRILTEKYVHVELFVIDLFKIYHGAIGKVTCKHPKIVNIIVKQMTFIPVLGSKREFRNAFLKFSRPTYVVLCLLKEIFQ